MPFPLMGVSYDNEMHVLVGMWVGGWVCGRVRADGDDPRRRHQSVILVQQVQYHRGCYYLPTVLCVWRAHFTM